ncbi:MAG: hypothetical protein IKE08_04795 [Clostridia bacterium]|nr:hypothetical protein [Clostridia bacterium]
MKKALTPILAIVAVIAIIFCFVFNGQKGNVQKSLDEANAQIETLKKDAATAADSAKAAVDEATAAKDEIQKSLDEATAAKDEIQKNLDAANAQIETLKADAEKAAAEAETAKKGLEEQVASLTKQVEDATAALKDAAAQKTEEVKEAATEAVEGAKEAVTEAVDGAAEKAEEVKDAATEAVTAAVEGAAEKTEEVKEAATEAVQAATEAVTEAKVMTHAEFVAAANDDEVTIESYVQDHQSWWDNKVTVYLQSEDGAYFAYEMACSEEDAAKLVPGAKIRVKGYKGEWAGEVEIMDGKFEFVEADPWIAEATDVTALLASDELANHMNEFVAVKGATIVAQENGEAFSYKNTEEKTDDLYFAVDVDGKTYNFCVEFYLRGKDSDVYKAVEGLKVGDVVDLEGFLYWYNGANLQATSLTVK